MSILFGTICFLGGLITYAIINALSSARAGKREHINPYHAYPEPEDYFNEHYHKGNSGIPKWEDAPAMPFKTNGVDQMKDKAGLTSGTINIDEDGRVTTIRTGAIPRGVGVMGGSKCDTFPSQSEDWKDELLSNVGNGRL